MLETRDLTVRFGGHTAVDRVSCAFHPGTLTAIVGPNGAGKTTYFNLISGQLGATAGHVLLDGEDLTRMAAPLRTRRGLGRAFQLTQLFPTLSVLENVRLAVQSRRGEGLRMLSVWLHHRELLDEAHAIVERVRLGHRADAPAASLPHGDQRKLEVAMLMALRPKVYLFDEPTAGMSVDEVPVILDLIRALKAEGAHTILLVEHKMDVVRELADRIVVLHQGQLVADGEPEAVIASPVVQNAYLGLATCGDPGPHPHPLPQCGRGSRGGPSADDDPGPHPHPLPQRGRGSHAGQGMPSLSGSLSRLRERAGVRASDLTREPLAEPLLRLEGVHTHIGAYHILHGVDLAVPEGEVTMLLGRNGAGKTTTLRTVMGLWRASAGRVLLAGRPVQALPTPEIARLDIAYVPENMGIFGDLTVRENLLLAARGARSLDRLDTARLDWLFGLFPALRKFWLYPAGKLSGGQKQMLAIARAMVEPRRLLLIDEPTKGLAPAIIRNLIEALTEIKRGRDGARTTVLLVEQNFMVAQALGDHVAVMDDGRVAHAGRMADLAEDDDLQQRLLGLSLAAHQ